MALDEVAARGLVLLGCGKMGSALLRGWLDRGLPPGAVHVIEPRPSEWLQGTGVALNVPLPEAPAVALVAVKPQMMGEALPAMTSLGGGRTLVVSIAAGTPLRAFEAAFGAGTPVVRAMPNTPAAVGKGITAIIGNAEASEAHLALAESLLSAVGEVVRLESEGQLDAVTGVSGSGPAYVFHLIEALAAAGEAEGLAPELSLRLARTTVAGAGALAQETGTDPAQLRRDVTSPNGTTQAGLGVLMDEQVGLGQLIRRTVRAAAARSEELGRG
ncbi:Pyrroline-5-carboxylate reductase [Rubellimicrobium mesophilum DSM 19309]|uniref:Pyrroline-5-carboxylate reductase n=1 Tax=Rubellimicrobium mesophilum DSM 19309 TaxID=442562 RepID=A0A017HTA3_9RHOB|nr:pyrroline-5-carboxylate reductase [Rubellimicrobium mesophilum]EYD77601.1 Pyrroline-5-carboxylate reductase [Rubellimicrobium mesophilum DSM 19309]